MKPLRDFNHRDFLQLEYISKEYDEAKIPLYLTYPTVPFWKGEADPDRFEQALEAATEPFLYFHFPYCRKACFYCVCYKEIVSAPGDLEEYLAALEQEIRLKAGRLQGTVSQLHWGGGTPTILTEKQITRIYETIARHIKLDGSGKGAFSIESLPAETALSPAKLKLLRQLGFTELSFGIQDFDPRVQKMINRDCRYEEVADFCRQARELGFRLHVDLCYGLPFQELGGLERTIEKVIRLQPDRIAFENYSHFPAVYPLQRNIPSASVPGSFQRILMAKRGAELFTAAGYLKIGDHFAAPANSLARAYAENSIQRDLMGYSADNRQNLVAFGSSAISFLGDTYYQNLRTAAEYCRALAQDDWPLEPRVAYRLSRDDLLRREIILKEILTRQRIDLKRIGEAYALDFTAYFERELTGLQKLAADGLVEINQTEIRLKDFGVYVPKHLARVFDRYY